jgi:hypothetical protein
MTQDEIIEMAKQAGLYVASDEWNWLEAFAKQVAAKEREACANYRAMYLKVRDELSELQQRTWVGLTDDEMHECAGEFPWTPTGLKCCRAIEAKLKEKNT